MCFFFLLLQGTVQAHRDTVFPGNATDTLVAPLLVLMQHDTARLPAYTIGPSAVWKRTIRVPVLNRMPFPVEVRLKGSHGGCWPAYPKEMLLPGDTATVWLHYNLTGAMGPKSICMYLEVHATDPLIPPRGQPLLRGCLRTRLYVLENETNNE
ncbi:MAG: hypothetical protein AAGB22_00955 [Bacteroidota bacterium]